MEIALQTLAAAVYKNKQIDTDQSRGGKPEPIAPAPEIDSDKKVVISLVHTPNSGMKGLVRIRQQLDLSLSIGELLNKAHHTPFPLLENVSFSKYQLCCQAILADDTCIEITDAVSGEIVSADSQ